MDLENRQFKIGSLFDGSGGFPLAASLCGMMPVWASEIEPFPIKVTRARFPNMTHHGDISKMNGAELEPVDVITGGSPCQDMSIAGKRQGMSKKCPKCDYSVVGNEDIKECPECGTELEYTRSGLFMEQIRVIKEMREAYEARQLRMRGAVEHIRPRFMLWENVTGAFSSNKGEDFRAVLEETARIVDKTAVIPRPPKGKWQNAGLIMADGYSIAWRVLDAQYFGVPQRRRRIALVADFGGKCAGEILFKREGLQRNFTESRKAWQNLTRGFTESVGEAGQYSVDFGRTADRIQMNADKAVTLLGEGGGCGAKTGLYLLPKLYDVRITSDGTKNARAHCYETDIARCIDSGGCNPDSNHGGVAVCECYRMEAFGQYSKSDIASCIKSRDNKDATDLIIEPEYIVRRLTPLECSRLQGFPDAWTSDIAIENPTEEDLQFWREVFETHRKIVTGASKPKTDKQIIKWLQEPDTDGAKYKMWGNGIALPCFWYVMEGIKEILEREERSSI